MRAHAATREYEKAAEKRDQLALLREAQDAQKIETHREYDQDVFATLRDGDTLKVEVFVVKRGVLGKREKYSIPLLTGQDMSDFLRAYYAQKPVPKEVILDVDL